MARNNCQGCYTDGVCIGEGAQFRCARCIGFNLINGTRVWRMHPLTEMQQCIEKCEPTAGGDIIIPYNKPCKQCVPGSPGTPRPNGYPTWTTQRIVDKDPLDYGYEACSSCTPERENNRPTGGETWKSCKQQKGPTCDCDPETKKCVCCDECQRCDVCRKNRYRAECVDGCSEAVSGLKNHLCADLGMNYSCQCRYIAYDINGLTARERSNGHEMCPASEPSVRSDCSGCYCSCLPPDVCDGDGGCYTPAGSLSLFGNDIP